MQNFLHSTFKSPRVWSILSHVYYSHPIGTITSCYYNGLCNVRGIFSIIYLFSIMCFSIKLINLYLLQDNTLASFLYSHSQLVNFFLYSYLRLSYIRIFKILFSFYNLVIIFDRTLTFVTQVITRTVHHYIHHIFFLQVK